MASDWTSPYSWKNKIGEEYRSYKLNIPIGPYSIGDKMETVWFDYPAGLVSLQPHDKRKTIIYRPIKIVVTG